MSGSLQIGGQNKQNLNITLLDYNGTTERHKVWMGFANSNGSFYIWDNTRNKSLLQVSTSGDVYFDGVTLALATVTISKNTYPSLYGDIYLSKSGRNVQMDIYGFKGLQGNYENTPLAAGTIPQAYRPIRDSVFDIFDGSVQYRVKIGTTGYMTVYPYGAVTNQNNVIATVEYLTFWF